MVGAIVELRYLSVLCGIRSYGVGRIMWYPVVLYYWFNIVIKEFYHVTFGLSRVKPKGPEA